MGLRLKVGEVKFTPLDEKKWYPARLVAVTEDHMEYRGKDQAKFRFDFVILDPPEAEGREVDGICNQPVGGEINERHLLYQWITALRGGVPLSVGDEIDFPDEFIGRIVYVQLKNKPKTYDGKEMIFQNVEKLAVCPNASDYEGRGNPPAETSSGASASSPGSSGPASESPTTGSPAAGTAPAASPTPAATTTSQPAAGGGAPASPTTPTTPPAPKATVNVPGRGKRDIPF